MDQEALLARRWGFRAIPNVWVVDEDGVLQFEQLSGFHISRPEDQEKLLSVLRRERVAPKPGLVDGEAGLSSYGPGARLIESGSAQAALDQWFDIVQRDPLNFLVRKQIWQYLYPDRFTPAATPPGRPNTARRKTASACAKPT